MEDDRLDRRAERRYLVPTMAVYRGLGPRESQEPRREATLVLVHWHETLFKKARDWKILMGIGTDGSAGS